ncbi:MAG: hypothetical protein HYZ25_19635 [Chloroflexi bacterium]|nr:hypothetical protein [Chloroflexota bacterium]
MSVASELIARAAELSRAGRKGEARGLLQEALLQEPANERAWLWYVDTFQTAEERIKALRGMLTFLPNHPTATRALAALEAQSPRPAAPPPTTAPVPVAAPPPAARPTLSPEVLAALPKKKAGSVPAAPPRPSPRAAIPTPAAPSRAWTPTNGAMIALLLLTLLAFIFGGVGLIQAISARSQLVDLQQANTSLNAQVLTLTSQLTDERSRTQALQTELTDLKKTALLPPYISIANRSMQIAFVTTQAKNEIWDVSFDALEYELQRGAYVRYNLDGDSSMWLILNNEYTGESYRVVNMPAFVDPSSFDQVIPDLYSEAGSDDAFIREVWNIVTQLATYSGDIGETPRYPLETFLAGGGDCEDTSILFASMIRAAPVSWDVELIFMDIDNPTHPLDVNHVIVYINTGSREYRIETTEHKVMEPYTDGVNGWYFKVP